MIELTLLAITLVMLFKWPRFTIALIAVGCLVYAICLAMDIIPIKESSIEDHYCIRSHCLDS